MKKAILATLVAMALLLSSCVTQTAPLQGSASFPSATECKILGRVTTTQTVGDASYAKLLEEAKKQYPDCDDVVNITIDLSQKYYLLFFPGTGKLTMSGIAIDYTKL